MYQDDFVLFDDDDVAEEDCPCYFCGRLIGDEVAYGDDWGDGPICEQCAKGDENGDL